jgi:Na+/H+ antiporter NhaD/arsenite permease-like protein
VKRKTIFLILMLAVTAIPTVVFFVGLFLIVGAYLSNSGHVQVVLRGNDLSFRGYGVGNVSSVEVIFSVFVGSIISCIVFFVSLFLLVQGWRAERIKKRKMQESYTV